jgi:hypothetical protein
VVAVGVVLALPGALAAAHLGTLALASLCYRERRARAGAVPAVRFVVLIPAYNEERVIARTLVSINAARRPTDAVVVVADRCTDRTADLARSYGALVLERQPGEEPGRAAARQAGVAWALGDDFAAPWDAMVMIDADSVVEPGFFDACERAMAGGAEALQARSEAIREGGLVAQATVASFALQGVLIPRGRDRLGLLVRLRGTGMVLSRRVVATHTFRGAAGEDRWYGLDLCLAGIRPRHVDSARLRSENVTTWKAASEQRLRYEAGRMSGALEFVRPLLRRGGAPAWEAAVELITPPFAIAVLSAVLGLAVAVLGGAPGAVQLALAVPVATLAAVLVIGLVEARAGWRTWAALASAPWYVLWKVGVQVKAALSVRRRQVFYPPTVRE